MKLIKSPFFYLFIGILALCVRQGLYAMAANAQGLLSAWHPLRLALLCICAITAVLAWIGKGTGNADRRVSALGSLLLALGFLTQIVSQNSGPMLLLRLHLLSAAAAAAGMLVLAYRFWTNRENHFLPYFLAAVFWCLHMVLSYQSWSSCPQIADYVFELFAAVTTTLYLYHRADRMVNQKDKKYLPFLGRMAIFFCAVAVSGSTPILSTCTALWLCGELSGEV